MPLRTGVVVGSEATEWHCRRQGTRRRRSSGRRSSTCVQRSSGTTAGRTATAGCSRGTTHFPNNIVSNFVECFTISSCCRFLLLWLSEDHIGTRAHLSLTIRLTFHDRYNKEAFPWGPFRRNDLLIPLEVRICSHEGSGCAHVQWCSRRSDLLTSLRARACNFGCPLQCLPAFRLIVPMILSDDGHLCRVMGGNLNSHADMHERHYSLAASSSIDPKSCCPLVPCRRWRRRTAWTFGAASTGPSSTASLPTGSDRRAAPPCTRARRADAVVVNTWRPSQHAAGQPLRA